MTPNAEGPTPESDDTLRLPDRETATEPAESTTEEVTGVETAATSPQADIETSSVAAPTVQPAPPLQAPARLVPSSTPPLRWGGIIWGALLIVVAAVTLAIVSSPTRLAGVTVWIAALTPGAALAVWIAALGLVIVASALVGAISTAQRNRRRRLG